MKLYFDDKYLGDIMEYVDYPQLEIILADSDIADIVSKHSTLCSGSATVTLVCGSEVYYFTQCPAKFIMAIECGKYSDIAPQIIPVGNYNGEYNVYKTQFLNQIMYGEESKFFDGEELCD